jgi:hypothetical protein
MVTCSNNDEVEGGESTTFTLSLYFFLLKASFAEAPFQPLLSFLLSLPDGFPLTPCLISSVILRVSLP